MRVLQVPDHWPKVFDRWMRPGEPVRTVRMVYSPLDWNPAVFFTVGASDQLYKEDWDEWMWWASDARLQKKVFLW